MTDYLLTLRESSPGDVDKQRKRAVSGDAESAFWMYQYYEFCRRQPRTSWQLERRAAQIEEIVNQIIDDNPANATPGLLDWPARVERGYALCSSIDAEADVLSLTLEWLEIAADLGHMPAQLWYHRAARELLSGSYSTLAIVNPDLIGEFKVRSDAYARLMLRIGHPNGLLLMAEMYFTGDVYDRDLELAYAYALAAEHDGHDDIASNALALMATIELELDPQRIRRVREQGRGLLDR